MKTMRQSKTLLAIFALLLIFGACKGESPTAPPTGGGGNPPGGGGGTTPPAGVELTLTTSNASPQVDTTVTLTATVTQGGQPVPNGTAVEFSTTAGGFAGTSATTLIRTTTNGVATVTLSAGSATTARVTAVVNNVSRTVDVAFQAAPVEPEPPDVTPALVSVAPTGGRPSGGETIRITGRNFSAPVRVFFELPNGERREAIVVSVTPTAIDVISPGVNLAVGQTLATDVIVVVQAGTANEVTLERTGAFTYRTEQVTPRVSTATPNSGPVIGGTQVEILGDGFQAPVQVLFGAAEARVISVEFNRIIVESPAGRDTSDDGSGAVTGPVDIIVRNINSQTSVVLTGGFRYVSALTVTAVSIEGSLSFGNARITIEGVGFVAPVVVVVRTQEGDIGLQPLSVSSTKIVALSPVLFGLPCGEDLRGPIVVTNVANGDQDEGPELVFSVVPPAIVTVTPSTVNPGGAVEVTVANAQPGVNRISIGDRVLFPSAATFDPETRTARFTVAVPVNLTFPTQACGNGGTGTQQLPINLDVEYENVSTGCADTATNALLVNPPVTGCVLPSPPEVTLAIPVPPSCADAGNVTAAGDLTGTATITFNNSGGQPLNISRTSVSGAAFSVAPSSVTVAPGQSGSFTVTFSPSATGAANGSVTFNTNDSDEGTITVCLTGTGT